MKDLLEVVGGLFILFILGFVLWLNIVAEPACEQKGYAGRDASGCYKIENGVRTHQALDQAIDIARQ